ncbi:MAG: hypothetical protein KC503_40555, partial [Myxococcales bacterium]|nr:hypothetical protein [Myxococcales bacterium]
MRALAHAARTAARAPLHLLLLALAALAAELALRWGITEALSSADPLPAVGAALLAVPLLATFAVACTATLARRSSLRDLLAAVARIPPAASAALLGVL